MAGNQTKVPDAGGSGSRRLAWIIFGLVVFIYVAVYYKLLLTTKIFTHDSIIWYGIFHYYTDSLANGQFPYWDPYMMNGTYFYPSIFLLGMLDPVVLFWILVMKIFSLSIPTIYIYFHLSRLFIFAAGAFLLFNHITRNRFAALLAASALFFGIAPCYMRTNGALLPIYLTPLAFYFLMRFLGSVGERPRYLYLCIVALLSGIIMNIYLPTYYAFNVIVFVILVLLFNVVDRREVVRSLKEKKLLISIAFAAAIFLMMMSPPLMMLKDTGQRGEIFPLIRMLQKTDGNFKKMMATDVHDSAFSGRLHKERGIFSSYGNMASMLYPDLLKSFTYWADHDGMSEIDQYIGIIPFLLGIIGLLYSKSRYRYPAIILLILAFINMFSFSGFYSRPFNWLQLIFNDIFPPLKMIEVRQLFGSYFLLYFCMLVSMGLALLFSEDDDLEKFIRAAYRPIISICAVVIIVKIFLSGYFEHKIIVTSPHDSFVIAQILVFGLCVYLFARGLISRKLFYIPILVLMMTDFYAYNKYFTDEEYYRNVLQESGSLYALAEEGRREDESHSFQYFRDPLPAPPGIAFGEDIIKRKGSFTYGDNHTLFCIRRYYDFYTHVPVQNQLFLSGVVFPVVSFFPSDRITAVDEKKSLLNYFESANEMQLTERLFIENDPGPQEFPVEGLNDIDRYEDIPVLKARNLVNFLSGYIQANGKEIQDLREKLPLLLNTPASTISVNAFSINEVSIRVRNAENGYLQYNDSWSKYWKAFDGDKELPVYRANYNFKAVFLEKGEHTVRFVFNPVHYKIGLALYYIGLMFGAAVIVVLAVRRKRV